MPNRSVTSGGTFEHVVQTLFYSNSTKDIVALLIQSRLLDANCDVNRGKQQRS